MESRAVGPEAVHGPAYVVHRHRLDKQALAPDCTPTPVPGPKTRPNPGSCSKLHLPAPPRQPKSNATYPSKLDMIPVDGAEPSPARNAPIQTYLTPKTELHLVVRRPTFPARKRRFHPRNCSKLHLATNPHGPPFTRPWSAKGKIGERERPVRQTVPTRDRLPPNPRDRR